jgi:hypothetical protein
MDSAFKDKLFTSFSELQNAIQEYELQYKKVMMKINDRFYTSRAHSYNKKDNVVINH